MRRGVVMLACHDEACQLAASLLRADMNTPIVMATGEGDPTDSVVGLELGAADYVPKQFDARELLARIRAVSHWSSITGAAGGGPEGGILRFGRMKIDIGARSVRIDGFHA
jgi:two-component system, OmpR family, phosphate regulon response regulator OmpR